MPIISTPHGLNIGLTDTEYAAVEELDKKILLRDSLINAELWCLLPGSAASIASIAVAFQARSIWLTLVAAVVAFGAARLASQYFYSPLLRAVLPQSLGTWMVAIPASLLVAWYLHARGQTGVGITQCVAVCAAQWGLLEHTALPLLPLLRPYAAERQAFLGSVVRDARRVGVEFRPSPLA